MSISTATPTSSSTVLGETAGVVRRFAYTFTQSGTGAATRTPQEKAREWVSSEDYFLAGEATQENQLQRAINAALAAGVSTVILNTAHTLAGPVTVASNSAALTIDGKGVTITLSDSTAGFTLKGMPHRLENMDFVQSSQLLTPIAVTVTTDATYTNTQNVKLRNLRGTSIYRGIKVYMPGGGQTCYRTDIDACEFSNFHQQKTWVGSYGIYLGGPTSGDAGGNDSKVTGGLVKGYETNVIVENSVGTQLLGLSNDGGAVGVRYDGGQELRIIGGYYEYNTTVIEVLNSPYGLYLWGYTCSNYTDFMTGALLGRIFGTTPIGGFSGGAVEIDTGPWTSTTDGKAKAYATNGVVIGAIANLANCTAVTGVLTATATLSFGSVAANAAASQTVALTGCTAASGVSVSCINGSLPNSSLVLTATAAADQVTVFCQNISTGAITANNVQVRVTVLSF